MRVAVVGANGFLGRNIVNKLLSENIELTCVYNHRKNFIPDFCEKLSIEKFLEEKNNYDTLYLVAATIPYHDMNSLDTSQFDTNICLPLKILEAFQKATIVFSSSVSVYGNHNDVITEDSSFNNPSIYGQTKLAAEILLKFHQNTQIIRFSSLYGKGMTSATFLPKIIEHAKKTKEITLYGDGSRLQDYLHIDDAVMYCITAAAQKKSGIYLGVNGTSYSNLEVANIIKDYYPEIIITKKDVDMSNSVRYDNSYTRKILDFTPKVKLKEGIKDIL